MIRKFELKDIDEVMSIWLNTNISAHIFIDKLHWENAYDTVKSLLPLSDLFVWTDSNTIKAFVGITDNSYIAGLFVDVHYQSQGIGKQLLAYAKSQYSKLELDVFAENDGAIRFYQRNGFAVTQTKMNFDFNHEEYHMVWSA